ncbi:MAG: transcriptional regulator [Solirubrobacteraceae bacterium]
MSQAAFDELIHAPLRLQICAMLSPVRSLPFSDIRDSLEISDSVLSKHLSALAEAGYVEVSRVRADSRSRRQVTLTKPGRTALHGHLAALRAIADAAEPAIAEAPSGARAPKASAHCAWARIASSTNSQTTTKPPLRRATKEHSL